MSELEGLLIVLPDDERGGVDGRQYLSDSTIEDGQ
jgi:hypothetical protein